VSDRPSPTAAHLEAMYRAMVTMRRFDAEVAELAAAKRIPGYSHTYTGSEAIAAGVCAALRPSDWIASTYRNHGHAIGKGVALEAMAAELHGRRTGTAKGKGGSMHISDFGVGMLGAYGIVAAGMPIALGAALSAQMRGRDDVAVAFFGDGAVHQGVFHEAMGLAKLWNAPVLMVCENNQYAEATALDYHLNTSTIADMAKAYALPGVRVDGMDVVAVYEATREAVERARSGGGATLLECVSYRFSGQYEGDKQAYQPPEEIAAWWAREPLATFERAAPARGLDPARLAAIRAEVDHEVAAAFAAAERAPWPDPSELYDDVYVSYEGSLR
jgi:acetoin:2,6-dichlorophenolindophenol oxidoreductase subunit alpha